MTKLEKNEEPFCHSSFSKTRFVSPPPRQRRRPELAEAHVAVSSFHMRDFEDEPSSPSLAGSLLVAHPSMLDPNFRRTVLFISEHDPGEGALGVIDPVASFEGWLYDRCATFLQQLEPSWPPDSLD